MVHRRNLVALVLGWVACGCGTDPVPTPSPLPAEDGPLPGPEQWNRPVVPPPDEEAASKRAACGYAAGALPAETQGASQPNGKDIPIDHVVVVMMENRSFDHYFQKLPEYGQPDVEVAPPGFSNPGPDGEAIAPFRDTQYCFPDTNHGWKGTHDQVAGGAMSGFVATNEGHSEVPVHGTLDLVAGKRAMGHYDERDLPFYYWLASEFAIADHYHCSVLGPTWPNRMFLYASTSFGLTYNTFPETGGADVLVDRLEAREVDWKVYGDGLVGYALIPDKFLPYAADHRRVLDEFYADAAAGTLPQVAFVDPALATSAAWDGVDEHPPAVAQYGQRFVAQVVDALARSPNWPRTALFITYDEHGGLYDHVEPPAACPPDDRPMQYGSADDPQVGFDQLGIRVPMILVSPWARKHFVGHRTYDHTSIARFIQARFVIPALSARDANAEAPWEMFDFATPPDPTPPAITIPEVDPEIADACRALFEP